ncbi:Complex I intermediate-associated protein 30 [Mactra antiquata]
MDVIARSRSRLSISMRLVNLILLSRKNNPKYNTNSLCTWSQCRQILRNNQRVTNNQVRYNINKTPYASDINLWDPKKETPPHEGTFLEEVIDGFDILKKNIPVYKQEIIDKFKCDIDIHYEHGDYEYFEQFSIPGRVDKWVVSSDSDTGNGKSTAKLIHSGRNTALFKGHIDKTPVQDGVTERAGFCSIRSPIKTKSFERPISHDWSRYTHICLNVRGDGRNYMLLMHMERYFDINALDMYGYPLYTRGGPYWQFVKIPLSHFLLTFKGRAQTKQWPMNLAKVKSLCIGAGDFGGNFELEIDYIALLRDDTADHSLDFKYELYRKEPSDL